MSFAFRVSTRSSRVAAFARHAAAAFSSAMPLTRAGISPPASVGSTGTSTGSAASSTAASCRLIDSSARAIFDQAFAALEQKRGATQLVFPRELIFLTGAPGAGKGTQLGAILDERDILHSIEVSSLFSTPAFEALKATGKLISDQDVVGAVLEALLDEKYAGGVVIDGFPRTAAQAATLVLLHERLAERCALFALHPDAGVRARTRRPRVTLAVLWCDEAESVARQLSRGKGLQRASKLATEVGLGGAPEARATDLDEERAQLRFAVFKAEVAACMAVTKDALRTVFIDATGPASSVAERTRLAFKYNASLDLDSQVYERLRSIASSSSIVRAARSDLVARLASYAADSSQEFTRVTELLKNELMPIIQRQALSGEAIVRSTSEVLHSKTAVNSASLSRVTLAPLGPQPERGDLVSLTPPQISPPTLFSRARRVNRAWVQRRSRCYETRASRLCRPLVACYHFAVSARLRLSRKVGQGRERSHYAGDTEQRVGALREFLYSKEECSFSLRVHHVESRGDGRAQRCRRSAV